MWSLVIIPFLVCQVALADVSCDDIISACDGALDAKNKQIELSDLAIVQLKDQNVVLKDRAEEAEGKLSSIWRNPFVYLGVGFVTGVVLMKR